MSSKHIPHVFLIKNQVESGGELASVKPGVGWFILTDVKRKTSSLIWPPHVAENGGHC
jgi:hypothetical protein